ncbi:class I SAM-dependent methyltransferase [Nocardia noduli]|uniref:class I SAM-dependent methyltransferase n=1 Tax=Nocardia noduli TaxID=2815722 RepID=UPI001C23DB86|nr:class I SAM-dependent methyltransferase [Nocardia noduli]
MSNSVEIGAAYDDIADLYVEVVEGQLAAQPLDRAMLDTFSELLRANESGPVLEVGCGAGRITDYLSGRGLDISGIDVSARMIAYARGRYPGLRFDEGSMERLDFGDGALAGLVAWYSIIHLPPDRVPDVLSEFYRVLRPKGHALLAFQAIETSVAVEAFDHRVALSYRWSPPRLAEVLRDIGFTEVCRMVRQPEPDERGAQGYLLVTRDH